MIAPSTETPQASRVCLPRELLSSTVFLLGRVGYAAKARAMEEFEEIGFSPYHYGVLTVLEESPRQTQAEIADALHVDRSQLVGLLDTLEERGLIERQRDPADRRRHMVSLTAEGRRQLGRIRSIVKRLEEELLAPLDGEGRTALHAILLDLARHHDPRCGAA